MEYELEKAPGEETEMVIWANAKEYRTVQLLKMTGSIADLASLCYGSESSLLDWLSNNGLLGFRPVRTLSHPNLVHLVNRGVHRIHGRENSIFHAYEPLCLIIEGMRVARAAYALYKATEIDNVQERQTVIKQIIRVNEGTHIGDEFEMEVFDIPIGLHRLPNNSLQWTRLAIEGLADITDNCLAHEFSLSWAEASERSRRITPEWKIRSHLGALFYKMAHQMHQRRYCAFCKRPLPLTSRPQTKTCSDRCRQSHRRRQGSKINGGETNIL